MRRIFLSTLMAAAALAAAGPADSAFYVGSSRRSRYHRRRESHSEPERRVNAAAVQAFRAALTSGYIRNSHCDALFIGPEGVVCRVGPEGAVVVWRLPAEHFRQWQLEPREEHGEWELVERGIRRVDAVELKKALEKVRAQRVDDAIQEAADPVN